MPDTYLEDIDTTPDKKILLTVSKDIDLRRGISEMVDNSIDRWIVQNRAFSLKISIFMNEGEQTIQYEDNSGGIKEENLNLIIKPGGTERTEDEETIGIFGIGSKRALIALSDYSETISRFPGENTFKIIVDDEWLREDTWKIPKYCTDDIDEGKTIFRLRSLKFEFDEDQINEIKKALGETYYFYVKDQNVSISVNGTTIQPSIFDQWAYPPNRHPRKYLFEFRGQSDDPVKCEVLVGLRLEASVVGEYGFDLYCNDRLVTKHVRDHRLGFKKGMLGLPHPAKARFYGIIKLNGKNKDMPWNSTKSDIDILNPTYPQLEDPLLKVSKPYVQLSTRLCSSAEEEILPHNRGRIEVLDLTSRRSNVDDFPDLPPGRITYIEKANRVNREVLRNSPWTRGLLENILAVDLLLKSKLQRKNRYSLILLDSCLEIALKEYIVNVLRVQLSQSRRRFREALISTVRDNTDFEESVWTQIEFHHNQRNLLYHETTTLDVTDEDITNFRLLVCDVLRDMFDLSFEF